MIRVLVADDSPTFRSILRAILCRAPEISVVGEAGDGAEAVRQVLALRPDVVTMDVRMPRTDGLAALDEIMRRAPTPVVVVTGGGPEHQRIAFRALEAGAVDVLPKPATDGSGRFEREAEAIRMAVRSVAGLRLVTRHARRARGATPVPGALAAVRPVRPAAPVPAHVVAGPGTQVVGIAASTGGPAALARILRDLPAAYPAPILVVQHIAAGFEGGLVQWLSAETRLRVKLAEAGEALRPGSVYVAPAGVHLGVAMGHVRHEPGEPVRGFRPSGTVLFHALAREYGAAAAGLVLSGMGDDGAEGLGAIRARGGWTAAQGPQSCVIYGMPRVALERGAAAVTLELDDIPAALARLCRTPP
jgi:two-component system, chemotaxis family, protein-glutamate methylesterase/glutaminase